MVKLETDAKQRILEQYDDRKRVYQSFLNEIKHQITSILQTSQVTCNAITSRLKTIESLGDKIERKQGKYTDLSEVTDIAGVRIITYYSADVDKIADIIESEFNVDHENSIDKRESLEPDRFGYCSVHYVVSMNAERLALRECRAYEGMKCEIQIRTVLQHAWAEIEHDIGYKSEIAIPKEMRRSFSRIAGLLEIADKEFDEIRGNLIQYKNEVQERIENDDVLDCEFDAVWLDVLLETNSNLKRLIDHIQNLTGVQVEEIEEGHYYVSTIERLQWFGFKTVRQVVEMIAQKTDIAIKIATEKLKDYKDKEDPGKIRKTIAYFYLCYALLLSQNYSENEIYKYLLFANIGEPGTQEEIAHELYDLGKKIEID